MSEKSLLDLTAAEIIAAVKNGVCSNDDLVALREAETAGKTRKTVIEAIDAELAERDAPPAPELIVTPEQQAHPKLPVTIGDLVTLAEAELRILGADYTGSLCEITVLAPGGRMKFSGIGETRTAAYRSAVAAWLASEGKALA